MRVLRWLSNFWIGLLALVTLLSALLAGGRLALPMLTPAPSLASSAPADGAGGVPVRTRIELRFSAPMNPRSVERALAIEPRTPAALSWDPALQTLTISPTGTLQPETAYRLTVGRGALSRALRPLDAPAAVAFRTVAAPAVLGLVPPDGAADVPTTTPIAVSFSRAMVARERVLQSADLPELRFDPPVRGRAVWVDQTTVLFRPDERLEAGRSYRVTLDAGLADLGGGPMGQPAGWSFRTAPPDVVRSSPEDGARDVPPGRPLVIELSQPLPRDAIAAGLTISPTLAGRVEAAESPAGTQTITYTAEAGWAPSTAYRITLRAGEARPLELGFTTAPRPALIGRYPGEGQILPAGQDIRLVFSTPVDPEALRGALRFDPPAGEVTVSGSDAEARVSASLRSATAYTLTIDPGLTDRGGVALDPPFPMRFTTAPAAASLALPEARGRLISAPPGAPLGVLVRRTNVSALLVDLYALDEATIVRTLVFDETDWRLFEPERYQRPLLRSWVQRLQDPLNAAVEDRLPVADADGRPLPPGMYYLRVRTPEGQRADLLLVVTRTRLAVRAAAGGGVVWATDAVSGTVAPGVPVAVYQDDALIFEGATGPSGLLGFSAGGGRHTYAVIARGPQPGLLTLGAADAGEPPGSAAPERLLLTAGGGRYAPGDTVRVAGFVRVVVSGTLGLPSGLLPGRVRLMDGARVVAEQRAAVGTTGVLTAALALPGDLAPGPYELVAEIGRASQSLAVEVAPPASEAWRLRAHVEGGRLAVFSAETAGGAPLAGVPVTWTLTIGPEPAPLPPGYSAGGGGFAPPPGRSGVGVTGPDGRLTVPISETLATPAAPTRIRIDAAAAAPDGEARAGVGLTAAGSDLVVGVRLGRLVALPGAPGDADVAVVDQGGRPQPGVPVSVDVFPADGAAAAVLRRSAVTGPDGVARVSLALPRGGAYRVEARAADGAGRVASAEGALFVAGAPAAPYAAPLLVADRASYVAGDSAVVLAALPEDVPAALLTVERPGGIEPEVRAVRAGDVLTVTLGPGDEPGVRVALLDPGLGPRGPQVAELALPVRGRDSAALGVEVEGLSEDAYAPGATAEVTVSVRLAGVPVPADVVVALIADGAAPAAGEGLAAAWGAPAAAEPDGPPAPAPAPPERPAGALFWSGPLRAEGGRVRVAVPMPDAPGRLRLVAWAAGERAAAHAERVAAVAADVALAVDMPPFLRAGDRADAVVRVSSSSATTVTLALRPSGEGLAPGAALDERRVTLAPYGSAQLVWQVEAGGGPALRLRVAADGPGVAAEASAERPVLAAAAPASPAGGGVASPSAPLQVAGAADSSGRRLVVEVAPSPDALAADVAAALAAEPRRSTLDEAGLLLVSAPLAGGRDVARESLGRLVAGQHGDGGWGWWPELESSPAATAAALEALAAARRAGLDVPDRASELGVAWASAALAGQAAGPDERAQLAYALSLSGRLDPGALERLLSDTRLTDPAGVAALLLALPPGAAAEGRLARLLGDGEPSAGWVPGGAAAARAWVLQAYARAGAPAGARESLAARILSARGPGGWGGGYASARAIVALRAAWPAGAAAPRVGVSVGGGPDLAGGGALTGTLRLSLPPDRAAGPLVVSASGGAALVSSWLLGPPPEAEPGRNLLIVDELDPRGGVLAAGRLEPGVPVTVRVTLVVRERVAYAELRVPLPPGADVVAPEDGPLRPVARGQGELVLAGGALEPGVYDLRYRLTPRYGGAFTRPEPALRGADGAPAASVVAAR